MERKERYTKIVDAVHKEITENEFPGRKIFVPSGVDSNIPIDIHIPYQGRIRLMNSGLISVCSVRNERLALRIAKTILNH